MKSDGGSSETKMPVHLVESLTAMREAAEKSEQRRIKPNKASRSRKSENNAINISNHCAELLRQHISNSVGKSCALGQALRMLRGLVGTCIILPQTWQGSSGIFVVSDTIALL